ncbi:MAG: biotin/lipoyl-containing protein [Nitrospinota bacterium]
MEREAKGPRSYLPPAHAAIIASRPQLGQGVVVVEAMKMENELRAPRAGVVRGVCAKEGESVEGGVKLVVVE